MRRVGKEKMSEYGPLVKMIVKGGCLFRIYGKE